MSELMERYEKEKTEKQNGLAITSSNDFYRLVVPIATMFFSFNIINK